LKEVACGFTFWCLGWTMKVRYGYIPAVIPQDFLLSVEDSAKVVSVFTEAP